MDVIDLLRVIEQASDHLLQELPYYECLGPEARQLVPNNKRAVAHLIVIAPWTMRDPANRFSKETDKARLSNGVRHHAPVYNRDEKPTSSQPEAVFVIHKIDEKIPAWQPSFSDGLTTNQAA